MNNKERDHSAVFGFHLLLLNNQIIVARSRGVGVLTADEAMAHLGHMMESYHRAFELEPEMAEEASNNLRLAYIQQFQRGIEAYNNAQSASDAAGFSTAAMHFQATSIIAPDSTGPYVNRAFALMNADRSVDAIEPLEKAIEYGEEDADVYTYLSNLYLTNDRAADAIPLLEKAVEAFPDNESFEPQLLNAYAIAGKMDEAIARYANTVEADPTNKVYRYNYGSLLLQTEQYEAAVEQLTRASELDENYTDAVYNLGAAYVNWAVDVNSQMNEVDDDLRARRSELSAEEVQAKETEIEELGNKRRELFGYAVAPLERAKLLAEAEGKNVTDICRVLFQSYVQTGKTAEAEAIQTCAGY